jgi:hypothetical protein
VFQLNVTNNKGYQLVMCLLNGIFFFYCGDGIAHEAAIATTANDPLNDCKKKMTN